jgi:hypothetical protein
MLQVLDVGQITNASVRFGDLTVLVGPQATGKSIFLELLKLLVDTTVVLERLKQYGLNWRKDVNGFLEVYLGEGMSRIWRKGKSQIVFQGKPVRLEQLIGRKNRKKSETLFFIPAQRVLTLGRGWPRPFTDYSPGDPFTVREFSEKSRLLMESGSGSEESLFPQTRRLKTEIRDLLSATIFPSSHQLRIDKHGPQKRLVLSSEKETGPEGERTSLPFMVWSAGQREFVPLLMGFYYLLPPRSITRRDEIEWVVIEELEMGLHPKAISAVMLLVLELLSRNYRVCISTHSPHVLDVVWALKVFQQCRGSAKKFLDIFDADPTPNMRSMVEEVLKKEARVYYFDPDSGETRDISKLDPGAEVAAESGWGGLAEFSGRVANTVAEVVSDFNQ